IGGATGTDGAYKIGDVVTASWDDTATGDNNGDIESVTVDFSVFGGGAAVEATDDEGTWTASYTIAAGSIDGTDKNISVTATDHVGNVTIQVGGADATVDNIAPA